VISRVRWASALQAFTLHSAAKRVCSAKCSSVISASGTILSSGLWRPSAYETVEQLPIGSAEEQTREDRAAGCLLVQGALACADEVDPIRDDLSRCRLTGQQALAERFSRAKASADLPADVDPDSLARWV